MGTVIVYIMILTGIIFTVKHVLGKENRRPHNYNGIYPISNVVVRDNNAARPDTDWTRNL